MKKAALFLVCFLPGFLALAQKTKTVGQWLVAEKWAFESRKVEFTVENGVNQMKILPGVGKVVAKDLDFANGTLEFDVKPGNALTFHFRYKNAKENECFYFRMGRAGNPTAVDAVQYAPFLDGVNMWDMYGHYQTNATFARDQWSHVKLVISGARMQLFINSPDRPTLEVDQLEGNPGSGSIAFDGDVTVSNLVVKPNEVAGLSPAPGLDPVQQDPRYIRAWAVSQPITTPKRVDFSYDFLPTPETAWQVVAAERRGLLNLTRVFGKSEPRRLVWLKVKIKSASAQKKKVDFGFGDDVWVFLNGQITYVDKNLEGRPIAKEPDGRCSIENTSFVLPLRAGHNELLIGLANDFFGWGAIARLENLDGIEVAPDPTFDYRLVKLAGGVIDSYVGTYLLPNGRSVTVSKENNLLKVSGEGFITGNLYPMADNRFFLREFNLEFEFRKDAGQTVSNFLLYNDGNVLMDAKRTN